MRRRSIAMACVIVLIASIAAVEIGPLRGHRVVEGLLVLAGLAGLAWASRGRVRDGLLVACSLAFGLTLLQAAWPMIASKSASRRGTLADDRLIGARPVVGWGPRHPGVFHLKKETPDGRVVYDVHATIDDHLDRRTMPSDGPRPIAFFGDSFVFGDGLDDKDALPQVFADLIGGKIPVLNLGFSGWAPSQNLAALTTEANEARLHAARHMILFTSVFHVERTACKGDFRQGSGPRYLLDKGTLIEAGSCKGAWSDWNPVYWIDALARRLGTGGAVASDALTGRDVETYLAIVEAFVATAKREYGAATTVLIDPGAYSDLNGTGYTQAGVIGELRAAGVDILVKKLPKDADPDLFAIPGDGHPTALANRVTAQQLLEHLRRVDPQALVAGSTSLKGTAPRDHDVVAVGQRG